MPSMQKETGDRKVETFREKYVLTWKQRWEGFLSDADATAFLASPEGRGLKRLIEAQLSDLSFMCQVLDEKFNSSSLSQKMDALVNMLPDIIKELGEDFINAKTDDAREEARRKLRATLEIGQLRRTLGRSTGSLRVEAVDGALLQLNVPTQVDAPPTEQGNVREEIATQGQATLI